MAVEHPHATDPDGRVVVFDAGSSLHLARRRPWLLTSSLAAGCGSTVSGGGDELLGQLWAIQGARGRRHRTAEQHIEVFGGQR
jgi:hypothetical protein